MIETVWSEISLISSIYRNNNRPNYVYKFSAKNEIFHAELVFLESLKVFLRYIFFCVYWGRQISYILEFQLYLALWCFGLHLPQLQGVCVPQGAKQVKKYSAPNNVWTQEEQVYIGFLGTDWEHRTNLSFSPYLSPYLSFGACLKCVDTLLGFSCV